MYLLGNLAKWSNRTSTTFTPALYTWTPPIASTHFLGIWRSSACIWLNEIHRLILRYCRRARGFQLVKLTKFIRPLGARFLDDKIFAAVPATPRWCTHILTHAFDQTTWHTLTMTLWLNTKLVIIGADAILLRENRAKRIGTGRGKCRTCPWIRYLCQNSRCRSTTSAFVPVSGSLLIKTCTDCFFCVVAIKFRGYISGDPLSIKMPENTSDNMDSIHQAVTLSPEHAKSSSISTSKR